MTFKNRICDRCISRYLKCNGHQPCNSCLRYGRFMNQETPTCHYTLPNKNEMILKTDISLQSLDDIQFDTIFENWKLFNYYKLNGFIYRNMTLSPNTQYMNEMDLQQHLIQLSFMFFIGPTYDDDGRICLPMNRNRKLSRLLKKSICFKSVFISTHPKLFSNSFELSNIKEKILIANQFKIFPNEINWGLERNVLELCDDIRALFISAMSFSLIGDYQKSFELNAEAYHVLNSFGLLNPDIFQSNEKNYTSIELSEILCLWYLLLIADTNGGMDTNTFYLDELPFFKAIQNFNQPKLNLKPKSLNRIFVPDFARFTLWDQTEWSMIFDDIKEISVYHPHYVQTLGYDINHWFHSTFLLRRIIKFSNQNRFDIQKTNSNRLKLHLSILTLISTYPVEMAFFSSLSIFTFDGWNSTLPLSSRITHNNETVRFTFINLYTMTYLHLSCIQSNDDTKYPLHLGSIDLYSSKQILLFIMKAICYVINQLSIKRTINDSIFGNYDYHPKILKDCMKNEGGYWLCPPQLATMDIAYLLYHVTCTCLIAIQLPPYNQQLQFQVIQLAKSIVYPCLEKISLLWPNVSIFVNRLKKLLNLKSNIELNTNC
ncbi:hypothetical protein BC833DRAFT_609063 [Globomyces pollinis-pini]|nr:hypothetical protein BC833DRAFT_609063 [Globomyces pollinis-pini]